MSLFFRIYNLLQKTGQYQMKRISEPVINIVIVSPKVIFC